MPRPHLVDALIRGLEAGYRLSLISAPAGYGKTTLVAEWLSRCCADASKGGRAAWLTVDEGDNNPDRFVAYVVAALQEIDEHIGEAAEVMLYAPQPPPMESILTSLLNDIVSVSKVGPAGSAEILILDDYHLISAQKVHDVVNYVLARMPQNFHLVLITRSDPPLPLARLRARGQLCEIRQADLQFAVPEATVFLNDLMGLSLSPSLVETLAARTEGWIAGLQLAALSMRGREDVAGFVEAFGGSHRFVMDYLVEEVVQNLSDEVKQFVLRTSVLGRLNAGLCETVTGQQHCQQLLESLEESNLFLMALDDDRHWFRYHRLFADMMSGRLQREFPDRVQGLHRQAAEWFQRNELYGEAIAQALKAGDHELAADIVEGRALALLRAGNLAELSDWLSKLPPQLVSKRPRLSVATAWVYLLTGRLDLVDSYLVSAEVGLSEADDSRDLRGEIAAIRTYAAAMWGKPDQAVEQAQNAFALLSEDNLTVRCVVAFVLGGVYFMRQDMPRALKAMLDAAHLAEQAGNVYVAVSALSSAGDLYRRQNNVADAEKAFYRAIQIGTGRSGKPLPMTASAFAGLAALRFSQRDLAAARESALTGLELGKALVNPESQVRCYLTLAQIEHLENDAQAARHSLAEAKMIAAEHQLTPGLEGQLLASEAALRVAPTGVPDQELLEPLSEHELKVLRLTAAGLSNREIAEELYLSVNTVKWHLKNIYEKLDVHSRVAAVTRAQDLGLL